MIRLLNTINSRQLCHTHLVSGLLPPQTKLGGYHFDVGKIVQLDDTIDSCNIRRTLPGTRRVIPPINLGGPTM